MTVNDPKSATHQFSADKLRGRGEHDASLERRLAVAISRWRPTVGERVLRLLGMLLALVALLLAFSLASREAPAAQADEITVTPLAPVHEASCAAAPVSDDADRLLLVVADNNAAHFPQLPALQEALHSYFGLQVQRVAVDDYRSALLDGVRATMIYGDEEFKDEQRAAAMVADIRLHKLPILWLGPGAYVAESELELELAANPNAFASAPKGTVIDYKGVRIPATGVILGETIRQSTGSPIRTLSTVHLPNGKSMPAISARDDLVHVSFDPFDRGLATGLTLAVAIDAFAEILGTHEPDPRVLFRLEDLNGQYYGEGDTSFARTADYLLSEDVFIHLAIIPEWVDAQGHLLADFGQARPIRDLIRDHPDAVSLIEHGFRHFRPDRRNAGLRSGDAFEFFADDDRKLGAEKARDMFRQRALAGSDLMARYAWPPRIFEAPHYAMSPGQQAAAEEMYPVIHHPPLFYAGKNNQLLLPWYTRRGNTVYAPSSAGFVAVADKRSVSKILGLLKRSARILPDPVYVVYFHPFMIDQKGREGDLARLISGIKELGYRFAGTCEDISRLR